jgi:hypothetical protein
MTQITLNAADIQLISQAIFDYDIDSFRLIKRNECSIGYLLDMEYVDRTTGQTERLALVTYNKW